MKKLGLFVLFVSTAVMAGAWGLEQEFVLTTTSVDLSSGATADTKHYQSSPLYKVLHDGKNNFSFCVNSQAFKDSKKRESDYLRAAEESIVEWIFAVRKTVQESGRADEFADILKWLPSSITYSQTSCDRADIRVEIVPQRPWDRHVWEYNQKFHAWQFFVPDADNYTSEIWKESGTFWGLCLLTDSLTTETLNDSSRTNTCYKNSSLYAVANIHPDVPAAMWWKRSDATGPTCDDVEGFINAVDFVQYSEGKKSARLSDGWKSLCGHPYYYWRGSAFENEEELDKIKEEWAQYYRNKEQAKRNNDEQTLQTLHGLLDKWQDYLHSKVVPALTQRRKALAAKSRPLDDKGLMLSAEVNHLQRVSQCTYNAIEYIGKYEANLDFCRGTTDCSPLQVALAELNCSPDLEPLDNPGLNDTPPLDADYPTGHQHTCAVCGKPIELGKAVYDESYERVKKKKVNHYRYYRHSTCKSATLEQARAYQDGGSEIEAPTYGQLQVRDYLADGFSLFGKKGSQNPSTKTSTPVKPIETTPYPGDNSANQGAAGTNGQGNANQGAATTTPKTGQTIRGNGWTGTFVPDSSVPSLTNPKPNPNNVAASSSTTSTTGTGSASMNAYKSATDTSKGTPATTDNKKDATATTAQPKSRALGTVAAGETVRCSFCGQEIPAGETYYKRTESQFLHRSGRCAYSFFAQKHAVDEASLASYDRNYPLGTPDNVYSAQKDMELLGLSTDFVRDLRDQEEDIKQQQIAAVWGNPSQKEARKQLNEKCTSYLNVSPADVADFEAKYSEQLAKIEEKISKGKELTKRQKRLRDYHEQLLKNEKLTQECSVLEVVAAW